MPHLRTTLTGDLAPDVLSTVEAFAALRWAAKLTHHVMERCGEKQGLSEGRLEVLARLRHRGAGVPLGELIESTWRASIEKQAPMAEGLSQEELIQLRHLCLRIVENMQQKLERGFTR
jgi:hypothetical protein